MSQKDTGGFAGRLAYVRWLRARGRLAFESDREFAKAVGVGYAWLQKWKGRADAPDSRTHAFQLADGLGVDRGWLLDGAGDPPEAPLWNSWLGARARDHKTDGYSAPRYPLKRVAEPAPKRQRRPA